MPEFKTVLYEKIAEHVLRITQNRPRSVTRKIFSLPTTSTTPSTRLRRTTTSR